MEPLSALSLFCNIVDICDRAVKVSNAFREIYKNTRGRRECDGELIGYLGELQEVLNGSRTAASKLGRDDLYRSIVGPLNRLEVKSTAIKEILDGFQATKPGNPLATIMATAKVVRGQGKLDRTVQELKQCRDDVHFAIAQSTM